MKDPQDSQDGQEPREAGLDGIALVGIAARFPHARDAAELWRNLRAGADCVSRFAEDELEVAPPPELMRDPHYVRARGVLEDPGLFDAGFFDIPPRQAELMDPQNRLFLECAWQALEDAGVDPGRFPGSIGVFGGVTLSTYFLNNLLSHPELLAAMGGYQVALATDRDYLTTFVSYKLGLRGPSLDVQTACSTSLVATVLACQSLLGYQCDLALAGGVSVKVPQKTGYLWHPGGLDSSDGYCRAFDAKADGSVYGSGVGIVALKRLEDALADGDEVYAVIRGAALNNDGSARVGFTAPGVEGQAEVIATAQALAGVDPESIGYVECHGSGTALGDPIEVAALTKAFRANGSRGRGFCAIGSIKTNLGHCSAAAGVAGLIKASLALCHREIPPSLHFQAPNPAIDFASSPFYVADRLIPWETTNGGPRRAGVSSFGLGGTNAHVVLEEAPEAEPSGPARPWQLLLLSARSEAALEDATDRLAADLAAHPDRPLADVAFTTQVGRRAFAVRRALVCRDTEDARQALAGRDPRRLLDAVREPGKRPIAFLLPGVGDHYVGMARGLHETEPVFKEHFDRCAELLQPRLGVDLRELVFADEDSGDAGSLNLRQLLGRAPREETEAARRLHRTLHAQPAVFAVEYALARLWRSWGVRPAALLGYSLGEYVAACLAGVMSLEDALLLVAERARLLDGLPPGAMLAVPLDEAGVRERIAGTELDLAAVNGPGLCVVAGSEEEVGALRGRLAAEDVPARLLPGTHAFHSRRMEPVAEALTRIARGVRLAPPKVPFVSNVTGTWITPAEASDPAHWARHLVGTVRFASGVAALWEDPARVLLEVGPGFGLSTLALQAAPGGGEHLALPSLRNQHERQPDGAFLLGALARLWLAGVEIDWAGFSRHESRRRVRLPGYPFERQRYWIETRRGAVAPAAALPESAPRRREVVSGGLTGAAFEQARAAAPGARLVLVEDEATARLIARLRELEALGAEVVVASAAEAADEAPPEKPAPLTTRHARPRLRNAWVEPSGEVESRVAGIFEELLGIGGVGAHDSFFELGGHSLLATRLAARLRDRFGVELPVEDLFAAPTPAGLAAHLAAARPAETAPEPPLAPVPRDGEIPLSHAQQRLWFLDRLMPGNPFYNLAGGALLHGLLDVSALRAALAEMARRHETLRTSFADVGGRPVQRIAAAIEIPLPHVDLTALPEERREAAVRAAAAAYARVPFDLGRAPLLRCALLRLGEGGHALVWAMHHIVSDAWSMTVLLREVAVLYAAFSRGEASPLPPLPVQYADFAVWQRRRLDGGLLERQLAWWRQRLAGAPVSELPTDRPRPALQTFRGATWRTAAPASLAAAVEDLARRRGVSPFMVLLAAFQALLLRWTGQEDVTVGTPIANRTHSGLEGLIGFFVNTLVLRTNLGGDPPFALLLERVRDVAVGAYGHQDLPFEQLVEDLQPRRDLSRNPLFQILFNLLNVPPSAVDAGGRLTISALTPPGGTALVDLQVYATLSEAGIALAWEHNTDLFEEATVRRLASHFETLLTGATAAPELRLSDLPLLSEAELREVLAPAEPAAALALPERFEAMADRTPGAVAVVSGGASLTYGELEARANQLARHLRRLGVGPESLVGVCLERSPDLVATLLAVGKAGGAYLPLDPAHPAERRAWTLADAGARIVVTRSAEGVPEGVRTVDPAEAAGESPERLEPLAGPLSGLDHRAYVLYTSGSTGRPKGVEVTRGAFATFLAAMARRPGLAAADALLAVTTVSFDIAGLEIFLPLAVGARIELADREEAQDGRRLAERIAEAGVTVLQATPATWRLLLAAGWEGDRRLRALCGGEALPRDLAAALLSRVAELWNVYGPTETTVWSAVHRVEGDRPGNVPIGGPIDGTALYLLGRGGALVPPGGLGELGIGGAGVARGYLGRPGLTAERFVPDPFSAQPGARLYRTGDLARRLPDGALEFLGRIDHQLKLRGYRIEPGEIEAALAEDPAVRQAVVALRADGPGEPRLVAWVVWCEGVEPDLDRLREGLRRRLPAYMLPAAYVELKALPLTPSGKVDRNALPAPDETVPAGTVEPPRTATEAALAGIWREVLGSGPIGVRDDFFEQGGHSLLATQVAARLRDAFGLELPLRVLFQETTLERLAARVDRERSVETAPEPPLAVVPRDGEIPLSHAQQRLWFLDRLMPGNPFYNLAGGTRLGGPLDVPALRAALAEVARRHETLRTSFAEVGGRPVQRIAPETAIPLPLVDLAALPEERREAAVREAAAAHARVPFDLGRAPLLRSALLRLGETEHALVWAIHHIVSDAWSMTVLLREVAVLYAAFTRGEASPLPPLPVQYADFAVWQRRRLDGGLLERLLAWWRQRLAGAPVTELPTDRPRPAHQTFRGATWRTTAPPSVAAAVEALARRSGASPFMVLLAAFQALLLRWTGQEDVTVGTPIANRTRSGLEGLIGFFVNTLVLRTDLGGDPPFALLLERVRDVCLGAYGHQDVPFEQLVEDLQPRRDLSRNPLFQILFNLLNVPPSAIDAGGRLTLSSLTPPGGTALFDLQVYATLSGAGIALSWEHNTDLFEEASIRRLASCFETLLAGAVADPDLRLSDLPLLSEAERQELLAPAEPVAAPAAPEQFEAWVDRNPGAPALVTGGESLTYSELEARANRLARHLRRLGVGPESLVGVCLERSPDLVATLLAVGKAGGAYVPLDPGHPAERRAWTLADAGARIVVTRSAEGVPEGVRTVDPAEAAGESPERLEPLAGPLSGLNHRAYVLYTSGSTGRPKGVEVTRGAFATFLAAMARRPGLAAADALLAVTTVSFDIAGLEIFLPLAVGARIELAGREEAQDGRRLAARIAGAGVTVLQATPATWRLLLGTGWEGDRRLRALCGGEALPRELAAALLPRVAELWNVYGPTETTVWSAVHRVEEDRPGNVPIGGPIDGTALYLLGRGGALVPPGGLGELGIGGAGVARGYLGRPGLTAERFVPDPFSAQPGARLYRTGDLARRLPDGTLEFLGRIDHQLKLRGYRIEPGEIEAALAEDPAVRQAVVALRADGPGEPRLVAWVVWREGVEPDLDRLREGLRRRLPAYMLPAVYVELSALPLTPSGKVDRNALPDPERFRADEAADFLAPLGEVEETLAVVWARLLGLERVGRQADFFALGGHSLLATQLVSRLREVFGVELPLRHVFEAPTLAALGQVVEQARREGTATAAPPLQPRRFEDGVAGRPLPLSFAQERLWFIDQLQPGLATYNLSDAVRLTGPLDVAALERAFAEVVARHEPLRTRFPAVGGTPIQEIDPPGGAFGLPVADLEALPEGIREGERDRLVRAEAGLLFDLARGPVLRAGLVRLGAREHVLALTLHHIVSDAWSTGVLMRELGAAYTASARGASPLLPALPVQYADWAAWQREWLRGEALEAQLAFWRERLGGEVPPLDLPLDRPRPAGDVVRGARQAVRVPAAVVIALEALGRNEEATLFMLLLAGFVSLLHRLTGQEDLTVGTPVAGRTRAEVEGLVGLFVNTLALRAEMAGDPPFREMLRRTRTVSLDAYSHQDLPFEKLVESLQPERVVGRTPLFQAMLVLQNVPAGELEAGDLTLAPVPSYNQTVHFDLTMSLTQSTTGLTGWLEYKPDLLDATTVSRWLDGFVRLLATGAADPGRRLSELPLLSDAERHQAVAEWNDTAAEAPLRPVCLHELFAEQAARTPDAIAVNGPGEEMTYRELERRAGGLARRIAGRGVLPGERVAVLMRPSPARVAAVLAVLAAGAAYVPLDPASPRERLEQMLRDSGARLLLADENLEIAEVPVLIPGGSEADSFAGLPSAAPGDLAYIVYTSGSTGAPKGVVIEHRQAVNTILDINRRFGLGADDRVFAISALSFDLSVWDLFGTLAAGGTVVLPTVEEHPDPAAWSARMSAAGVTVWDSAPPLLDMLVESGAPLPPTLRLALLSGDWIPVTLPGRVRRRVPACRVVSLGGATEGSIWSILFPVGAVDPAWRSIPYGRPMQNQRFHVVDRHGFPVPVGVAGELRIGGAGVAVGYFGRPELTAERFVPDPFADPSGPGGARLYRTGDLGRFRADGTLEFLGRLDTQVKIRGFRVELGEIETVLSRHPGVREAVVLARQDGAAPAAGGDRRLAAYVVPDPGAAPSAAALRAWLAERLPDFMVPPHFLFLEGLPVTPNGKLDRRALPAPEAAPRERVAPRDSVEQHLAEIWARLLGIPEVGVLDNFFELGGHSLLATRLVAAVREEMGVELPLREVFERPTVAGLALAVAERRVEGVAEDELARLLAGVQGLSDEEIERLLAADMEVRDE